MHAERFRCTVQAWYAGVIAAYNARRGVHWVEYDDGDEEWVDLRKERWEFLDPPVAAAPAPRPRGRPPKQAPAAGGEGALSLALLAAAAESADGRGAAAGPQPASAPAAMAGTGPPSSAARAPSVRPVGLPVRPASAPAIGRGTLLAPAAQVSSNPLRPRPAGPQWLRPPPTTRPIAPPVVVLKAEPRQLLASAPVVSTGSLGGVSCDAATRQTSTASLAAPPKASEDLNHEPS